MNCEVLRMDGNKGSSTCIVRLDSGETVEWIRSGLKDLMLLGEVNCLNYKLTKAGVLVKREKSEEAISTLSEKVVKNTKKGTEASCDCEKPCKECNCKKRNLLVKLCSYDTRNGICSLMVLSNKKQTEKFLKLLNAESAVLVGNVEARPENDSYTTLVEFLHIDVAVNALAKMPNHILSGKSLMQSRTSENFAYMTDEQFNLLCDYLSTNLIMK